MPPRARAVQFLWHNGAEATPPELAHAVSREQGELIKAAVNPPKKPPEPLPPGPDGEVPSQLVKVSAIRTPRVLAGYSYPGVSSIGGSATSTTSARPKPLKPV